MWGFMEELTAKRATKCLQELAGPRWGDGCSRQRERHVKNPRGFQRACVFGWW